MEAILEVLRDLRRIVDRHAREFRSDGFVALFETLSTELGDEYFRTVEDHLHELGFQGGVPISAELGRGNSGTRYVLHRQRKRTWTERLAFVDRSSRTYTVADRDEAGARALGELRDRGVNLAANALAQSADHIASLFNVLAVELAFYLGCLNLHQRIEENGGTVAFPVPTKGRPELSADGLYDVCLSLTVEDRVVGNDVRGDGKSLVMITGANQGGKSTFLRSIGLAQLMMQAGMFVAANSLRADVRDGSFTHFRREEDAEMESGKLDEELARMSEIVDQLDPGSLLLCNESFASTNEREGSEIARQIVRALLERGVKVLFVTHMFDLAHGFYSQNRNGALFLRAEREPDGGRTFRLREGEPLPTSHAADVYRDVFGVSPDGAHASERSRSS
jgi:DNA mismatch repair ATPase MutS